MRGPGSAPTVFENRRFVLLWVLLLALASSLLAAPEARSSSALETLRVDSSDPDGTTSTVELQAGQTYRLTAKGTYGYGFRNGRADAECSTLPPDTTWQSKRYLLLDPDEDLLDLYVDDEEVDWRPTRSDPLGCNSSSHTYTHTFEADETGPVNLRIFDRGYGDNGGILTVEIVELTETLVDTVTVPSGDPAGVTSAAALDPDEHYRFRVEGTYAYGEGQADAECSTFGPDPTWQRNRFVLLEPQEDLLDLYVNGANVAWRDGDALGCDPEEHTYDLLFRPDEAGSVRFHVKDGFHGDNSGALTVEIFRLSFPPPPDAPDVEAPLPAIELTVEVPVDSSDPDGTTVALVEGRSYLLEAEGAYEYGAGTADARCSNTVSDPTFRPSEENYPPPTFPEGILRLLVDEAIVDWAPTEPDDAEPKCNSSDHTYRFVFVPEETGPVTFRVKDSNYGDNAGTLDVRVFRIQEVPLARIPVDSSDPDGSPTPPLLADRKYRLRAEGTYGYFDGVPNTTADAECSQGQDDPVFRRHRFGTGDDDLLDVFIDEEGFEWLTQGGSETGCDDGHVYGLGLVPDEARVSTLAVADVNHRDNTGVLLVDLFLETS